MYMFLNIFLGFFKEVWFIGFFCLIKLINVYVCNIVVMFVY